MLHVWAQTDGSWFAFGTSGQLSHASPMPSRSRSACFPVPGSRGLNLAGQLSQTSPTRSPSASAWFAFVLAGQLSQASPTGSPSELAWFALGVPGQLSQASPTPSGAGLSVSAWFAFATVGQLSHAVPTPSPSPSSWLAFAVVRQLSHASPTPSLSESACTPVNGSRGFAVVRQLSQASPTWSPSPSSWFVFAVSGQLSDPSGMPSLSRSDPPTCASLFPKPDTASPAPAVPPATSARATYVQPPGAVDRR